MNSYQQCIVCVSEQAHAKHTLQQTTKYAQIVSDSGFM